MFAFELGGVSDSVNFRLNISFAMSSTAELERPMRAQPESLEGSKLSSSSFEFEFELARTFCR